MSFLEWVTRAPLDPISRGQLFVDWFVVNDNWPSGTGPDTECLDDAMFFALIVNCAGTCSDKHWYDELPRRILIVGDAVSESEVVAAIRTQIGKP
ncbi:MAG: hypothetical protein SFY96_04550 [Planctomycetota bacterium]|nr:hypothetical protein [Planctomycetota bacterium]